MYISVVDVILYLLSVRCLLCQLSVSRWTSSAPSPAAGHDKRLDKAVAVIGLLRSKQEAWHSARFDVVTLSFDTIFRRKRTERF